MRFHAPIALSLWILVLGGCGAATDADRSTITLTGSSTVAPLVMEIAKRFESEHPGTRIDVQTGGSSRGAADARSGLADIGMVSRALNDDETDLTAFTIARDGVCLIVHADNPIAELTDEQVIGIYTGKIENWRELNGVDAPITVVHKAEGRSTLELFLAHFHLDHRDVQPDVVIGENLQGIQTVAGNPQAVGYVSIGTAEAEASLGASIKLLPIGGVAPSEASVADGVFPLCRPLNLVTSGSPSALAREFLEFAQSDAVHDLVREQHFVPATP